MLVSELKANARKALEGKWGKGVLITLCYVAISVVISMVSALIPVIGPIIELIVSVPIAYGMGASFIKLKRGEDVKNTEFLDEGFSKFGKVWGVAGHTILKMILPIILVLVCYTLIIGGFVGGVVGGATEMVTDMSISGTSAASIGIGVLGMILIIPAGIYAVVKGLLYIITDYILFDNPDMPSKEIVETSQKLMNGKRAKYIWLELTFIGWMFLAAFTFGIGLLWLIPYMMLTVIGFYEDLAGKSSQEVKEEENPISE